MTTAKEDYLATLMQKQSAMELLNYGADAVARGGVSGIKHAADVQPELILLAISRLSELNKQLWREHLALVEYYFEALDDLESLSK